MTEYYLRNTVPDAISGAVSACGGIRNSLVLLNGPIGCKTYYCFTGVDSLVRRENLWGLRGALRLEDAMEDRLLRSQYFTGSARVPSTNLRYSDYIFGTREQLRRALNDIFSEQHYDLFTVIQTPGTSLLGEALEPELQEISEEFGIPYVFVETTPLSESMAAEYDACTVRLLEKLVKPTSRPNRARPVVNLFGLEANEKYPEGTEQELRRLLDLCGITVGAAIGLNCSLEEFRSIGAADANIMLVPERCAQTAAYLWSHFDAPVYEAEGEPIGFDATERFVKGVSELLGTDPGPALEDIERARARAFYFIARTVGSSGFPRDLRYAAEGSRSMLLGYIEFLSGYLGIRPKAIHLLDGRTGDEARLRQALEGYGCAGALEQDIAAVDDAIVLAGANTITELSAYHNNIFGIENANPGSPYIHVVPKTHAGCAGALYLLEQILNGTKLLNAWN